MPMGTVRWFNRTVGAGFIRTDDGENVLFLRSSIKGFDPNAIREGLRVHVDVVEGQHGHSASHVKAVGLQES